MELSPLAREKLARAGELSETEKKKMKLANELTGIMADFFTRKLDNEGLWTKMKQYQESGNENVLNETQTRLAHTLSVGGNDRDFTRYSDAILSLETLKSDSNYAAIESSINVIKELRNRYQREKDEAFIDIKSKMGPQLRIAAQQMAAQPGKRPAIDIEGSIEASVKASPQWRDFIIKYESDFSQKFESMVTKLVQLFN
jgi:hypothetical protein